MNTLRKIIRFRPCSPNVGVDVHGVAVVDVIAAVVDLDLDQLADVLRLVARDAAAAVGLLEAAVQRRPELGAGLGSQAQGLRVLLFSSATKKCR